MRNTLKRLTTIAAAAVLAFTMAVAGPAEKEGEKLPETAVSFTLQTQEKARLASGKTYAEWDAGMESMRTEGLANPVTEEALRAANPNLTVRRDTHGRIYMIEGAEALGRIGSPQEAARAAYRLTGLLEAPEGVKLRFSSLQSSNQLQVYLFQQVFEGRTVVGSTVKLAADPSGKVCTVFSSLQKELPESAGIREITAAEAEETVRQELKNRDAEDSVAPEYTTQVVLTPEDEEANESEETNEPEKMNGPGETNELEGTDDPETAIIAENGAETPEDDVYPDDLTWIVYSANPDYNNGLEGEMPWLAHYVAADGRYLYANQMAAPGDGAGAMGYPAAYTFAGMERAEWTGKVLRKDGSIAVLTVPVMRDSRTGVWYLGDPERKIAVGDFSSLAYGDEQVQLISSPVNDWDSEDLITYANMIRVWDFYAETGWKGPDGAGTPVLLLKSMRTEDGEDIYNAAYVGTGRGWQCFAYGEQSYLGQGLDVMAHEYTHCVTTALMNTNLYEGDYGAINEAMSDIMGNICEQMLRDTDDTEWLIGENSGEVIRSMLNPHEYGQPEYVWDVYYAPDTDHPNDVNDRGGVHSNSSILNLLAAKLCAEDGMPLETARNLWFTVAMGSTSSTDYPQMAALLPWSLRTCGLDKYAERMDALIAATRMAETSLPEKLPEELQAVSLKLPEGDVREDGGWVLMGFSLDMEKLGERLNTIGSGLLTAMTEEDGQKAITDALAKLGITADAETSGAEQEEPAADPEKTDWHEIDWDEVDSDTVDWDSIDWGTLALDGDAPGESTDSALDSVLENILLSLSEDMTQHMTWRARGEDVMKMVTYNRPAFYVLLNLDPETADIHGAAVYLNGRWHDVMGLWEALNGAETDEEMDAAMEKLLPVCGDLAWDLLSKVLPFQDRSGEVVLSNEGLENVARHEMTIPEEEAA